MKLVQAMCTRVIEMPPPAPIEAPRLAMSGKVRGQLINFAEWKKPARRVSPVIDPPPAA
ncbi:MAG TPA: hypothetical protein VHW24_04120 [Bryobacteraceae bacterium]|nr:hypothetical protein [Bryobacteraceae bacterium]